MFSKHPVLNVIVGTVAAMGTYSDTLGQVPRDVAETVSQAPNNWEDLEKALISMAVACVSQLVLTVVPKLFKKLSHAVSSKKSNKKIAVEIPSGE